jgi:[ribosomal protein S18]-alanine N-acetyltransferase
MRYTFTPIQRKEAQAIAAWRYDGPYSLYDGHPEGIETLLLPDNRVHAARDERGELVGFCSFGEDARVAGFDYVDDALDVGLGMRPDLVGQSLGIGFTRSVLDFAQREYSPSAFRVTIAGFNRRAQRLCRALGFQETARFLRDGATEFVVFRRESA